jgi:hypothetical protein
LLLIKTQRVYEPEGIVRYVDVQIAVASCELNRILGDEALQVRVIVARPIMAQL